jgi:hypothetical protein
MYQHTRRAATASTGPGRTVGQHLAALHPVPELPRGRGTVLMASISRQRDHIPVSAHSGLAEAAAAAERAACASRTCPTLLSAVWSALIAAAAVRGRYGHYAPLGGRSSQAGRRAAAALWPAPTRQTRRGESWATLASGPGSAAAAAAAQRPHNGRARGHMHAHASLLARAAHLVESAAAGGGSGSGGGCGSGARAWLGRAAQLVAPVERASSELAHGTRAAGGVPQPRLARPRAEDARRGGRYCRRGGTWLWPGAGEFARGRLLQPRPAAARRCGGVPWGPIGCAHRERRRAARRVACRTARRRTAARRGPRTSSST